MPNEILYRFEQILPIDTNLCTSHGRNQANKHFSCDNMQLFVFLLAHPKRSSFAWWFEQF